MKLKIPFLLTVLFLLGSIQAQELQVTSPFIKSHTRNEARLKPRVDFNHDTCALVIVSLDFEEVDFEGDIKLIQLRDGEWWVYLSPGANWLTVLSEKHLPLRIDFAPVRPATTYTIALRAPIELQKLIVTSPCHEEITMVDASRFRRTDTAGRTCALLRIGMVLPEAQFPGAVDQEYRRGEWWVWLPADTRAITVIADGYQTLTIPVEPLKPAVTYVMSIVKGGSTEVVLAEPQPEPKVEPQPEPKVEPMPESKVEPQPELNVEPKPEPKVEPQPELNVEPKPEPKVEPQPEPKVEPMPKPKVEPIPKPKVEPMTEPKSDLSDLSDESDKSDKSDQPDQDPIVPAKPASSWSWGCALASTVVPGLGQTIKGYAGSGVATLLGEAALAFNAYRFYNHMENLYDNIHTYDGSSEIVEVRTSYQAYQIAYYACIGTAAALHVYNIIRAGTMKPHSSKRSLTLAPGVIPTGLASPQSMATSLNLTFKF